MMAAYGIRAILSVAIYAMMNPDPPDKNIPVSNSALSYIKEV